MKKRMICMLLLAMPAGALAARRATIRFPVKVGLMLEGGEVKLTPGLRNLSAGDLVWESSDENVAQIWDGKLMALKPGKAIISASGGGAKARCGVVVLPKKVEMNVGEQASLPRGGVESYAVRDKRIASVGKKGVVTGLRAGQTQLMVRYGKQRVVLEVNVGASGGSQPGGGVPEEIGDATQVVLVEYTGGSAATLSLLEKHKGAWQRMDSCQAWVGENGIDKTRAGDKRTPTGVYNLTTPFGIKSDPGAKMPYTKVTKYHYWCGDSSSRYYNQLVDERTADRRHTSADEYLIRYRGVYNYCLFIDYNAAGEPGKGSCIFLHCSGSKRSTSGCVAIPEATMKKVIRWARPGIKIVIRRANAQ